MDDTTFAPSWYVCMYVCMLVCVCVRVCVCVCLRQMFLLLGASEFAILRQQPPSPSEINVPGPPGAWDGTPQQRVYVVCHVHSLLLLHHSFSLALFIFFFLLHH